VAGQFYNYTVSVDIVFCHTEVSLFAWEAACLRLKLCDGCHLRGTRRSLGQGHGWRSI